jgi:dienelactone hydrolase
VAFYPYCGDVASYQTLTPLLILHGEADDWTPIEPCRYVADNARVAGRDVTLVAYPGAHHAFDDAGLRRPTRVRDALGGKGATIAYDADAHADARKQVRAFLARELKGTAHAPTGR